MRKTTLSTLIATTSAAVLIGTLIVPPVVSSDGTAPCNAGSGSSSTECGVNSTTGTDIEATAVGDGATATGTEASAFGQNTTADGTGTLAVGTDANADAVRAHAIGRKSAATATTATAVGANAQASGLESVALGGGAGATFSARASGDRSVAIGGGSSGNDGALASANNTIAIGNSTVAGFANSVAIGLGATTLESGQIVLGSTTTFQIDTVGRVGAGVDPAAPLDVLTNASEIGAGNAVAKFSNGDGPVAFQLDPNNDGTFWNVSALANNDSFVFSRSGTGAQEMRLDSSGNMVLTGTITTAGPTCGSGCDAVFGEDHELPTIDEHAAAMWANGYLPVVGPTVPGAPVDLAERYGVLLNELETAHIYIDQLNTRLAEQDARLAELEERLLADS